MLQYTVRCFGLKRLCTTGKSVVTGHRPYVTWLWVICLIMSRLCELVDKCGHIRYTYIFYVILVAMVITLMLNVFDTTTNF